MKKEVRYCDKCSRKLIAVKTDLRVPSEAHNPEDPYDGSYKPIYFYYCKCWQVP